MQGCGPSDLCSADMPTEGPSKYRTPSANLQPNHRHTSTDNYSGGKPSQTTPARQLPNNSPENRMQNVTPTEPQKIKIIVCMSSSIIYEAGMHNASTGSLTKSFQQTVGEIAPLSPILCASLLKARQQSNVRVPN